MLDQWLGVVESMLKDDTEVRSLPRAVWPSRSTRSTRLGQEGVGVGEKVDRVGRPDRLVRLIRLGRSTRSTRSTRPEFSSQPIDSAWTPNFL